MKFEWPMLLLAMRVSLSLQEPTGVGSCKKSCSMNRVNDFNGPDQ